MLNCILLGANVLKALIAMLALLALVVVGISLASVSAQEQVSIEIRGERVPLAPGEALVVKLYGREKVTTVYSFPSYVRVELTESFSQGLFYSVITVRPDFSINKECEGELIFRSSTPFNLTLTKMGTASERIIKTYACPANVTLRLLTSLGLDEGLRRLDVSALVPIFDVDPWAIIPYAIFTPLFGVALLLDIKDMKRRKAGKWDLIDSLALTVKYLFYASLVSLLVVVLWTLGYSIYTLLVMGTATIKLGGLLLSLTASSIMGLIYAVAHWRGWYELIDEED